MLARLATALACVLVAACVGPSSTPTPSAPNATGTSLPTPTAVASGTAAPSPSAGSTGSASPSASAAPTIAGPSYDNPVFANDFPDPHIIRVDNTYYAYSTNTGGSINIPTITSDDLVSWERAGDALSALPTWAALNYGLIWAPGVIQIGDGFVMYFVGRDTESDRQCIGVAVADAPDGSFRSESDEPFICQVELGGSIDAYPFEDEDGTLYLFWKNDGNCCGYPVGIWVQRLSDDGLVLEGEPVELIRRDQAWEVPLIENPAVVLHDDTYYLFYSANWWESKDYAVGYAICEEVTGPCSKPQEGPIFKATAEARGPGGQSFVTDVDGTLWMAYHAWEGRYVGYPQGRRSMRIDPVTFDASGVPVITGPTVDPQPMP